MNNSKNQPKTNLIPFLRSKEFYVQKSSKYYQQNQINKAISLLQKALTIKPIDIDTHFQLSTYLSERGDIQEANKHLRHILDHLDSSMTICYYYLGVNYAQQGIFKEAAENLEIYLKEDIELDFEEEAIEILGMIEEESAFSAIELEEEFIFLLDEGRELVNKGHLEEAIQIFESIIEEQPEFWPAYNNLAVALFHLDEKDKALDLSLEVLEKSDGNLHAYCNIVIFLYFSGKKKEANVWAKNLRQVTSLFDEQTAKIGATFGIIGMYKESYRILKPLFYQGYYGEPAFYYWLASSAEYLGESSFAKTVWNRYVEEFPEKKGQEPWKKDDNKENDFFYVTILFELFKSIQIKDYKNVEVLKGFLKNRRLIPIVSEILSNAPHFLEDSWETNVELLFEEYCKVEEDEERRLSFVGFIFPILPVLKKNHENMNNSVALTAAIDYLLHTINEKKVTYKNISEKYNMSAATVSKYVKMLTNWMEDMYR